MKTGLLRLLFPSDYVSDIYHYDFEAAYARGKRLILFDIDNTMVPHGAPADEAAVSLAGKLKKMGFMLTAISNNKEPRVRPFCDAAGVSFVCSAGKPSAAGFQKAMDEAGCLPEQTLFFGDQIFTDILGANRAGVESVLVRPVAPRTDEIQIVFKRFLEKPVIKAFLRERKILH